MRWSLQEIARATGAADAPGPTDPAPFPTVTGAAGVDGVTIDSRRAGPGSLFVAIVADRDGHDFIGDAIAQGAGAYLYEPARLTRLPTGAAGIAVGSTSRALLDLGTAARRRLGGAMVVGITGSVGKTSTKDLTLAAVAAGRRAAANEQSYNNELGVPLTLVNVPDGTEVVVVEMGARGVGHIAALCAVASPTVAVVTAVAAAHTEAFGSIEAVARAKGELVEALPGDGLAVLNGDDPRVAAMRSRTAAPVLLYGLHGPGSGLDVVAEDVTVDDELRPHFTMRSPWGTVEVSVAARGEHQVGNALAALAVAAHAGVDLDDAAAALATAAVSRWRMELHTTAGGARVINDAYNANPTSMAAALRALAQVPARGRRVAVLGAMAELGPEGPAQHRAMAELAATLGIEVVAVGTDAYGVPFVAGVEEAAEVICRSGPGGPGRLGEGDAVLVKASRSVGLERLVALLM